APCCRAARSPPECGRRRSLPAPAAASSPTGKRWGLIRGSSSQQSRSCAPHHRESIVSVDGPLAAARLFDPLGVAIAIGCGKALVMPLGDDSGPVPFAVCRRERRRVPAIGLVHRPDLDLPLAIEDRDTPGRILDLRHTTRVGIFALVVSERAHPPPVLAAAGGPDAPVRSRGGGIADVVPNQWRRRARGP